LVTALILTRFREAAEKAAAWLTKEQYHALFLNLPEDLTPFVREYMEQELPPERLWRSYGYLTGLQEPFLNALRYQLASILNVLPELRRLMPQLKVYCSQDLACQIEVNRLSERLLLLATSERVRKKIRLAEWRRLLADELELAALGLERLVENVVEDASMHRRSVILYGGLVKPLKDCMEVKGLTVKPIYLQRYWRNPLDVLRILSWSQGVNRVPDEVMRRCVRTYLSYLDYVLASEDVDTAHAKWTVETQPHIL
jgi:hypothetical protein